MTIARAASIRSTALALIATTAGSLGDARAQPVFDPANGHYYEAVPGVLTWEDARSAAALREFAGLPGHLATLTDADESAFVIAALGGIALRGYHIGGYQAETCAGQNDGWHWVTGEPWSWTHWDSGEPNGPTCGDRLELAWSQTGFADGRWNDIDPTSTNTSWVRGYLVEYEPPHLYFNPGNGHYYERIDAAVTWETAACLAASRSAVGLRGHLATITTPDELAWIISTMGGADLRGFHLGGYQRPGSAEPAGGWTWITNEPWVWTNWAQGEPNDQYGDDRLQLIWRPSFFANGAWNDITHDWLVRNPTDGYQVRGYIVEYSDWSPFTVQPEPISGLCGGPGTAAEFTAHAEGPQPFGYQWQRNGADLSDGPTPSGSVISGATTSGLRIAGPSWADAGEYTCTVTDGCALYRSAPAALSLCLPNCDCSSAPPILNVSDFICFLNRYAAGDPSANCDASTTPPILNVNDFVCFQNRFARGCP